MTFKTLQELDAHIAGLSPEELADQQAKTKDNPQAIFDLVKAGDTVGVAVAIQNGISPEITDDKNMTPLHYAAGQDTQLIGEVLIREVSAAPWMRDKFDRLPLDITQDCGHDKLGHQIERVTYPKIYKELKNTPEQTKLLERYDAKQLELDDPSTALLRERELQPKQYINTTNDHSEKKIIRER